MAFIRNRQGFCHSKIELATFIRRILCKNGLLLILMIGIFSTVFAQNIEVKKNVYDYGEVRDWKNDTARFEVKNGTAKLLYFLPTKYAEEYQILLSAKSADPGETIQVAIVYYPSTKGKFLAKIPLYFNLSPDPVVLSIKGNIKSFDPSAQIKCPVVNDEPAATVEKIITIEVRNRMNDEILIADQLQIFTRNNKNIGYEKSGAEYEAKMESGEYRVVCRKTGFDDYAALIRILPYQNRFVVYLSPEEKKAEVLVSNDKTPSETSITQDRATSKETIVTPPASKETIEIDSHEHEESNYKTQVERKVLDPKKYKTNNLIFIVDISTSMKKEGKLDQLKASMTYLIQALRPEDKITIIALNSTAKVLQSPTHVYQKDSLTKTIEKMKAEGSTNAGAALSLAYQIANQNFIDSGNNQIIIATDGAFNYGNISKKEMEKNIAIQSLNNIFLSTLAFGNDERALAFLANLAEIGKGNYVQSQNTEDLLDMLKTQSAKR